VARATLATVKRQLYENLGVTDHGGAYGTLKATDRYPTGYLDDKIAEADIYITTFLAHNKQDSLLQGVIQTSSAAHASTIPEDWVIIGAFDATGSTFPAKQVDYSELQMLRSTLFAGIIAANSFLQSGTGGHFAILNNKLYLDTYLAVSGVTLLYITMSHASSLATLYSPAGFEACIANLASANALMKRGDKPDQAQYYMKLVKEFLSLYGSQELNSQEDADAE
jgi:hypothetical protein